MITTKVSERVYMIDTVALGRPRSVAAYVLKGSKVALVDCGYAASAGTVLEGMRELGISPSEVDYIVPTHVHLDHAGAAGETHQADAEGHGYRPRTGYPPPRRPDPPDPERGQSVW